MSVVITAVSPERTRGSATFTIDGTGFGPTPGDNTVLVSGSSATIVTESSIQITLTLPFIFAFGIVRDVHVPCQLINNTNNESAYFYIRLKANVDEVADAVLVEAIPGPFELLGAGQDRPRFIEAKDSERLAALIEALMNDVAAGQVLAGTGIGLSEPGGSPGEAGILVVDASDPTGVRWAANLDWSLPFGAAVPAAATFLAADGDQATVPAGEDEQSSPTAATLDLVHLLVKSAGPTLDRVRIFRDGSSVSDSGTGLGLGNNGVYTATPALAYTAGQRVQVECTALGGSVGVVGGVRLVQA